MVFLPTKHHVEYCLELLRTVDVECAYIYSSLDQVQAQLLWAPYKEMRALEFFFAVKVDILFLYIRLTVLYFFSYKI